MKFLKVIIGVISSLVLLAILFVFCFIILTFDKKNINREETINDNHTLYEVVGNRLYNSCNDVTIDKEIDLLLNEKDLELIIYKFLNNIDLTGTSIKITGVSVRCIDGEYYLRLSGSFFAFYSTVIGMKLNIVNTDTDFTVSIDRIEVGRLSFYGIGKILVKEVANRYEEGNNKKLLKINAEKLSFSIKKTDVEEFIVSTASNDNKDLLVLLYNSFFDNKDLMYLSFGQDNLIGAKILLEQARYQKDINGELYYNYDLNAQRQTVERLLSEGSISNEQVSLVYDFLIRGYDALSSENKNEIDSIDLKSIGISDNKKYSGIIDRSNISLENYIIGLFANSNLTSVISLLNSGIIISDDFLTGVIQSLDFVGTSFAFSDYNNKVGYLTIEELNIKCFDQKIRVNVIVNINGLNICFETNFICLDNHDAGLKINGKMDRVALGSYELHEKEKQDLLNYLQSVLSGLDWITVNNENDIVLDFSKAIKSAIDSNDILGNVLTSSFESKLHTYVEDGHISIKYKILG